MVGSDQHNKLILSRNIPKNGHPEALFARF